MKIKILVVSHDAGGANILNALVKKYNTDFDWKVYAKGPAIKIFRKYRNAERIIEASDIEHMLNIEKPDLVLTGTSWASNLEIDFIRHGKSAGIKTAVFLDHWCNYKERFGYPGSWKRNLPHIIFTGDKCAYNIALKAGFPEKKLRQVENPYLEEIIKEAKLYGYTKLPVRKNSKIRILYLSEPVYEHALKSHGNPDFWGYTEYGIVKDLANINDLCESLLIELKVRLHPSEKRDKYNLACVNVSRNKQLIKDCLWADIIVGGDTMALAVASMIGRKVFSYIPSVKKTCSLPQEDIIKVDSLKRLIEEIKLFKKNGQIRNNKNRTAFDRAFLREIFN